MITYSEHEDICTYISYVYTRQQEEMAAGTAAPTAAVDAVDNSVYYYEQYYPTVAVITHGN